MSAATRAGRATASSRALRRGAGWRCAVGLAGLWAGCGCQAWLAAPHVPSPSQGLAWLSAQGAIEEPAPRWPLEHLRPTVDVTAVAPGELIEVTVWNLYEPGQPHTFPVRLDDHGRGAIPLLKEEVELAGQTVVDVESVLREQYEAQELLIAPRIVVRTLEPPAVRVEVAGGVAQPGVVKLARREAHVYGALLAAGGLAPTAGEQISVTRAGAAVPQASAYLAALLKSESAEAESEQLQSDGTPAAGAAPAKFRFGAWHDVRREADVAQLAALALRDGDVVRIEQRERPVRVVGAVRHPGPYSLPAAQPAAVWDVLNLAGGVAGDAPLEIRIVRPVGGGRPPERWACTYRPGATPLGEVPPVEPGDVVEVERASPASRLLHASRQR